MKWIIIVVLALTLLAIVIIVKPGIAAGSSLSENVTISFSNSLTIETTNISTAVNSAANTLADNQTTLYDELITLLIAVALVILALWKDNIILYCLAAPVNMVLGLSLATSATVASARWIEGLAITVIGLLFIFRVAIDAFIKSRKGEG